MSAARAVDPIRRLGVIADDLTGACDVAAGLSGLGREVAIALGVPGTLPSQGDIVVALRTRTAAASVAARQSVTAARALRGAGASLIYQKYCSTFDSTDEGNIGPVADALLDEMPGVAVSVGTPVTPAVARTMHRGHLFVGDRLLSESSLARHPLTPMTDPDLVRVLGRQTSRPVGLVPIERVRLGGREIAACIDELRARGVRHVLCDAVTEGDLDALADGIAATEIPLLLGGGAGLVVALARRAAPEHAHMPGPPPPGERLILSGSGSQRTRRQVAAHVGPRHDLDIDRLLSDEDGAVADALAVLASAEDGVPLITATADPDEVARGQRRHGREVAAAAVEHALARIAVAAVEGHGVRRILVAGGETSGAVAAALGVTALDVRRVAAPGVAWTTAVDRAGRLLDLCLKSGNFGGEDFFGAAWAEQP